MRLFVRYFRKIDTHRLAILPLAYLAEQEDLLGQCLKDNGIDEIYRDIITLGIWPISCIRILRWYANTLAGRSKRRFGCASAICSIRRVGRASSWNVHLT